MEKIRISVIMGIYNCASTLVEALDSLMAQTYQGFKVIMCDDGSRDNTYQVAQRYAEQYPGRFVLVKNEHNMGLNYTLNHCLKYADTEYVARMDGDDVSLPTRFEKEINFLDQHPEFAIVSSPMIYYDENGEFGRGRGGGEPTKFALVYGPPFCHAPCMVRKEAYDAVNGYTVDPKLLRFEDYNLWMKMFALGYRGYMLDECLYAMRDDRNAIKRRTLKSAFRGIYAHYLAHKTLNLPYYMLCRYSIIKIGSRLVPTSLYAHIHNKKIKKIQQS